MDMQRSFWRLAEKPWVVNVGLLFVCIVGAVAVDHMFLIHHHLHEFNEAYDADAYFLMVVMALLAYLVMAVFRTSQEAKKRGAAERVAAQLAREDSLTGLPNRRAIEERLATTELASGGFAVFMLDLNDFKPINDIFGHADGDHVLKNVASRLRGLSTGQDFICRIGGDEFAFLSGSVKNIDDARNRAAEMTGAFDEPFVLANGAEVKVGVAIGCHVSADTETSAIEAMRKADLALYRAKDVGGNAFVVFESKLEVELRRRKLLERKLRAAIANSEVKPFFQPLVDLKTSQLVGFEALARWTDHEMGSVPPNEFISVAESVGLITELSESLMRQAFTAAATWPSNISLSFNISPVQFKDAMLGLRVMRLLGETGLIPTRLQLEITESAIVAEPEHARRVLEDLRSAGISTALDDFGTGYSSLSQLRSLKFDNLKIDRAFVSGADTSKEGAVILNTMLSLSRGLGLVATAEGIEDETQLKNLIELGCEHGQGYFFGKAISAADAHALVYGPDSQALSA